MATPKTPPGGLHMASCTAALLSVTSLSRSSDTYHLAIRRKQMHDGKVQLLKQNVNRQQQQ